MSAETALSSQATTPGSRTEAAPTVGFRDDIQGLRAIAVVSVVIFHAFPEALPGGFVGVDVFFVISGFLITGILHRSMLAGRFTLADFYRRRIRRIYPALFLMLVTVGIGGYFLLSPQDYTDLAQNMLSATLFVSNIDFFLNSGYFDRAAELRPLLHTWSLAVEEQFYIFFPPLLWLVLRYARRLTVPLMLLGFVASLLLSQWALGESPTGAYFLTPFRIYELLVGSIVAVMATPGFLRSEPLRTLMAGLGLALICASILLINEEMPFPGVVALPPVIGSGLVLLAGRGGTNRAGALISSRPFLFFGAISYSFYLWHWPLLAFLRVGVQPEQASPLMLSAIVLATILISWLSYRFVEQPIAHRSVSEVPFLRWGLSGMAVLIVAAGTVFQLGGLPGRFSPSTLSLFAAAQDFSPQRADCHRDVRQDMPYEQTCILGAEGVVPTLAIWGDSHGVELSRVWADELATEGRSLRQITGSACPPVLDLDFPERPNCRSNNTAILAALKADDNIQTVVLLANAVVYFNDWHMDIDAVARGYQAIVDQLTEAGKSVVLVSQIPNMEMEAPTVAGYALQYGRDPHQVGRVRASLEQDLSGWRDRVRAIADSHTSTVFFDPVDTLCNDTLCPIADSAETVLYFNPTHVSLAGARRVLQGLKEAL